MQYIAEGAKHAGRSLADIELNTAVTVEIGEDAEGMIASRKPGVAFNLGGMGSANTNFYNDVFKRAGFSDDALAVQSLWLAGKRQEAAARVPDEMVLQFSAIGTPDMVAERLAKYRASGVNNLNLRLDMALSFDDKIALLEATMDIVKTL